MLKIILCVLWVILVGLNMLFSTLSIAMMIEESKDNN